ncbi:MAG: fimbrial protein [Serratia inhibens]|uniref:fimbrial protein n=1 Tax=Serratia inhibens TaxID=2338073 RepID=UPI003C7D3F89
MHITKIMLIGLLAGVVTMPVAAADNMRLHGALVAEPCTLLPGDESVQLDFGTVVDKYLYQNQRTFSKPFQLRLADCDTSLGKAVKVRFTGTESPSLPGLLAIDGSSQAQGVAIGFETPQGQPLLLDALSQENLLGNGSNIIEIKAYVRGEPSAITNKTINLGAFSAVATFTLFYE